MTEEEAQAHGSNVAWPYTEILGPKTLTIEVSDAPELSPFHAKLFVLLDNRDARTGDRCQGRYWCYRIELASPLHTNARGEPQLDYAVTNGMIANVDVNGIIRRALRNEIVIRHDDGEGNTETTTNAGDDIVVIYALAKAVGDDPTKAVADTLGISRGAAAQRVSRARQAGAIDPADADERPISYGDLKDVAPYSDLKRPNLKRKPTKRPARPARVVEALEHVEDPTTQMYDIDPEKF